jgi:hypothetical protein
MKLAEREGFGLDRVFKNRPFFALLSKTYAAYSAKNSVAAP